MFSPCNRECDEGVPEWLYPLHVGDEAILELRLPHDAPRWAQRGG